jgi:hypothetical protein
MTVVKRKNRTSLESHKNYTKENVFGTPVNLATNIYSDAEKPVRWNEIKK